ncbi:hypothetical protein METP3_02190 [Methanosarcinales archaeon]|nr:hypothetical protein METP3_02190 [Methanosarcinales archaeon]
MTGEIGKYVVADLVGNVNAPIRDAAIKQQNWKAVEQTEKIIENITNIVDKGVK